MSVGLPLTIPNAFARNARWFAGGEAVVDSATRLTYAELDDLSLRAAALFAALGAEPGKAAGAALRAELDLSGCLARRDPHGRVADGAAHARIRADAGRHLPENGTYPARL